MESCRAKPRAPDVFTLSPDGGTVLRPSYLLALERFQTKINTASSEEEGEKRDRDDKSL